MQAHGQRVQDQVALWHDKAAGNCAIDYGFHQIIGEVNDESLKAMDELIGEGITSFKLFMAYPGVFLSSDGQIVQAMQTAAGNGGLIMMHAENGSAIDVLVQQALARGETAPYYHGVTRPWQAEQEATHRAVMLADLTGAPLYVVHVSAKQALARIAEARNAGQNVFGETCPQYLYLSLEEHLGAPEGFEGAKWVCSTPLRSRAEGHQDELWKYIRTGDVTTVSTDHCPFCMKDQKEMGIGDFSKIPNGIGSVEHRMDLLYQGVVDGRICLERGSTCAAPRRRGCSAVRPQGCPRAGCRRRHRHLRPERAHLASGSGKTHHMNMDYSAWEGYEIDGHVDAVLSRGTVIVNNGELRRHARATASSSSAPSPRISIVMDFGVVLQNDPPAWRVVDLAVRAENYGFSHVWTFDSHLLWQEPYVIYSQILSATRTGHRRADGDQPGDPRLDGDRVAVRDAERHVRQPHDLRHRSRRLGGAGDQRQPGDAGDAARVDRGDPRRWATASRSNTRATRCASRGAAASRLPIWVAAYGPKALALTGEVADGFILQLADPDITAWSIAAVRKAAAEAGRDPADVTICVAAPAYVTDGTDDGLAHGRDQCRWFGGMVGNHVADIVAPLRRRRGGGARGADRLHRRRARATTTTRTARPATRTPTSSPTRSSTGSA